MEFAKIKDGSTILTIFEKLPFQPKRIYYMQGMDKYEIRGRHKHKKNRQILICIQGSFSMTINDSDIETITQNSYAILEPSYWHEMTFFSPDCIILVLASEEYDKNDYIREKDSR